MVGAVQGREAAAVMIGRGLSERRSCGLVGLELQERQIRAASGRAGPDGGEDKGAYEAISAVRALGRYGRVLRRAGEVVNIKRVHRWWKRLKLQLARKRPKRQRSFIHETAPKAVRPNQVWTYDFVFDQVVSDRKLKMLTLVDECRREPLAVALASSITAAGVRRALERVTDERGLPEMIRSGNDSEFIAAATENGSRAFGIKAMFIEPGKPWQNGKCESFNGKLREAPAEPEMVQLDVGSKGSARWRKYYNTERPDSALSNTGRV